MLFNLVELAFAGLPLRLEDPRDGIRVYLPRRPLAHALRMSTLEESKIPGG